eukprot:TRINITY_DN21919_c0_g1_i1.p1 TRINITY_DN21919_c0_g1~~TRINITY_DN21919_c0_g1_i1.p1  ORF type:complete len:191 (+),score=24.91 TRINITY_DN21919_c0_g1_i1:38-610(+)
MQRALVVLTRLFGHSARPAPTGRLFPAHYDDSCFDIILNHVLVRIDDNQFNMKWVQHWEEDLFWQVTTEVVQLDGTCELGPDGGIKVQLQECSSRFLNGRWLDSLDFRPARSVSCERLVPPRLRLDGDKLTVVFREVSANTESGTLMQSDKELELELGEVGHEALAGIQAGVYPSGRSTPFVTAGLLGKL